MANTVIYLPESALDSNHLGAELAYYLSDNGEVLASAALEEVVAHFSSREINVVISASNTTLTWVELNRKQARHLDKVLPFLLEENLLDAPEALWFSHQKAARNTHQYPIVVCDKEKLATFVHFFTQHQCRLVGVWVDAQLWSSLAPAQVSLPHSTLLMQTAHSGLRVPTGGLEAMVNALGVADETFTKLALEADLLQQLAATISRGAGINLLHGEFSARTTSTERALWQEWKPSLYFAATIFAFVCVLTAVQTSQYKNAAQATQQQTVSLYQELFPGSAPPQLLQRQFETQLRRLQQSGSTTSRFMQLMYPVGQQFNTSALQRLEPQRLQYDERDAYLSLDVSAPEFALVEQFSQAVKQENLDVSIGNSRTESGKVRARLRVE